MRRSPRAALLLLCVLLSACCCSPANKISRDGQVLDSFTNEPVPFATVEGVCESHCFSLEEQCPGSKIALTTDALGRYTSPASLSRCKSISVGAVKTGYVATASLEPIGRWNPDAEGIPARLYLTPVALAGLQRLVAIRRGLDAPSRPARVVNLDAIHHAPIRITAAGERMSLVYSLFTKSRFIAATPREEAYVRAQYCRELADLQPKLTPGDEEFVRVMSYEGAGTIHKYDFEQDVVPYCAAQPR